MTPPLTTTTTTTSIPKKSGRKNDLKAFVRIANGMIVPSSVILARKMPAVGKWQEIDAYTCCQQTTTTTTTQNPD